MCQGSWADAAAFHVEFGWCYTIAVSAGSSTHWLPRCGYTVKVLCASFGCIFTVCMGIYGYIKP